MKLAIDQRDLSLEDLARLFGVGVEASLPQLVISDEGRERLARSRQVVEDVIASGETVYGVNTGFGRLASVRISADQLRELQVNLLRSHACGVGDPLEAATVRACLLLRIRALAQGYSGVRPQLVETMVELFNRDVRAVIPSRGSVGASGDLAPLAHLALVLIGEGQADVEDQRLSGADALARLGVEAIDLQAKEGLALINGTQVTTALGVEAVLRARNLARHADLACAMTVEALKGTDRAYDEKIQRVRGQLGQQLVAANLRGLMANSEIRESHAACERVQDPYSLRCAPQVHGAARDSIDEAARVFQIELNAVTDNPLVFPETGEILSGGNFHAQPVAAAADRVAAAVTDLASISERRIENLVNPDLSGLPAFLTPHPGISSGFMVLQVAAAALVAECRSLSFPAAVDSIPTSANKEDHVSMGPGAAQKARQIVANAERVLAIEILAAAQGKDFETRYKSSPVLEAVHQRIRRDIPTLDRDRSTSAEIEEVARWIVRGTLLKTAAEAGLELD